MREYHVRPPGRKPSSSIEVEALWREYIAALERTDRTRRLDDALVAGHAWASFLRAFEKIEMAA